MGSEQPVSVHIRAHKRNSRWEHEAFIGIRHVVSRLDNWRLEPGRAWCIKVPLRTCVTAANHATTRYDELHNELLFEKYTNASNGTYLSLLSSLYLPIDRGEQAPRRREQNCSKVQT